MKGISLHGASFFHLHYRSMGGVVRKLLEKQTSKKAALSMCALRTATAAGTVKILYFNSEF
jgi:hypothetical protein